MDALCCYFLSLSPSVRIGKFTRLLPSLDVVAVSQAPSPESNPNSPLPVIATLGQYPSVES
jgi:hypothetical protein